MKTKKILTLIFLFIFVAGFGITNAQVVKTKKKDLKKAIKQKTKELEKKKYTAKGAGSVEIYVTKAINKEFELDEKEEPKNSVVYTSAVDPSFEGAVSTCRAAARATLAGNIETSVGELIKRSINNEMISAKSANGINQTVIAGKQLIAQKISMEDVYVLYREVKDERDGKTLIEVEYAGVYSKRLALQKIQEYIREQMKDETEELHKDLDKIFKLD